MILTMFLPSNETLAENWTVVYPNVIDSLIPVVNSERSQDPLFILTGGSDVGTEKTSEIVTSAGSNEHFALQYETM